MRISKKYQGRFLFLLYKLRIDLWFYEVLNSKVIHLTKPKCRKKLKFNFEYTLTPFVPLVKRTWIIWQLLFFKVMFWKFSCKSRPRHFTWKPYMNNRPFILLSICTWFLKSVFHEIDFWTWFFVYFELDFCRLHRQQKSSLK